MDGGTLKPLDAGAVARWEGFAPNRFTLGAPPVGAVVGSAWEGFAPKRLALGAAPALGRYPPDGCLVRGGLPSRLDTNGLACGCSKLNNLLVLPVIPGVDENNGLLGLVPNGVSAL